MGNIIYEKSYSPIPVNIDEVYRYAGIGDVTPELIEIAKDCIEQANKVLSYKVCYGVFEIKVRDQYIDFGFAKTYSLDLAKVLKGCSSAVIFAATVGLGMDRLITRYGTVSPARAVMLQAIGAERIESLCNKFNTELKEKYITRPRFSPGYGDFPLEFQREIFNLLSPNKRIGLTLNESLLMSPTKSVTAVVGIMNRE